MLLLSLNRKKYPLKILKLDSCDITGNPMYSRSLDPKKLYEKSFLMNLQQFSVDTFVVFHL